MIFYISSSIYSFIKIDDKLSFESSREIEEVKLESTSSFLISATPINNNEFMPTLAKVVICASKVTCESKNIILIKHNTFTYEIIVLFEKAPSNLLVYQNKLDNKSSVIVLASEIAIQKENKYFKQPLPFSFSDFDLIEKQNYIYFIFSNTTCAHLVVFNKETTSFFLHNCDKMKKDEHSLYLVTKNNDFIKSYSTLTISLKDYEKNYLVAKKYAVDKLATNKNVIPFAFMQAIKIRDFALARKYLSPSFSNSLQDEHLINFFGDFIKAVAPKVDLPPLSLSLIYKKENLLFAKHFCFSIEDNKIIDISSIQ